MKILGTFVMPCALIFAGIVLGVKIRLFRILSPRHFFRVLKESASTDGTSPLKAMCTALAGTLGVGNIAGVATAITAGGAGAVMWMWIGSALSMSVKYAEVALAVKYRHRKGGHYYGGSMYTVRDGLSKYTSPRVASFLGGVFALFCIANSLLMGNIVQTSAACSVFDIPSFTICISFAALALFLALCPSTRLYGITYAAIPLLSGVYAIFSLCVIIPNFACVGRCLYAVVLEAFALRPAVAGAAGFGMSRAVRYGITRGIFSNEAGCGTSPTAHAAADTPSPHHQGCFGIFEVIADTPILCTMTALVILIAEEKHPDVMAAYDGVPLVLAAFESVLGRAASFIIGISVIFFALATIAAQLLYGKVAVGYFSQTRALSYAFVISFVLCSAVAAYIPQASMWYVADATITLMTLTNVSVLLVMRREVKNIRLEFSAERDKIRQMYCNNRNNVL